MSKEVKEEFKSLIRDLSKEICEKSLKKDVNKLNTDISDLEDIAEQYRIMQLRYNDTLQKFSDNNTEIIEFKKSLNVTNIMLRNALEKVDMTQVKILKKMMDSNNESLEVYKKDVELLNQNERKVIKKVVETVIELKMNENNKELNKRFNELLLRIKNNNELFENMNNNLREMIALDEKIEGMVSSCREKIEVVEEKCDKKMKYIMILASVSIILNIVGIFIK